MILPDSRVPQNIPKSNCHYLPPMILFGCIFGYIIYLVHIQHFNQSCRHTQIPSVDLVLESQSLPGASAFRGAPEARTVALPAAWPEHFAATWRLQSLAPSPHLRLWLGNREIFEGSLEVKLHTIWTDEAAKVKRVGVEKGGRKESIEETESQKKEEESGQKGRKSGNTLFFRLENGLAKAAGAETFGQMSD